MTRGREFSPDLDELAQLASSFARAYPALAPRLSEHSDDPDVERLLDAFGFLTEKIHRLLDESPAPAHSFATLVAPELDRGFPCASILAITPGPTRKRVPAGARFESVPVAGVACTFCAWSAFDLVPWNVESARIAWSSTEGQSLVVSLQATGDGALSSLFPLRLHLAGEGRVALALQLLLRCDVARVELRAGDRVVELDRRVTPWGLDQDQALLPPEPFEHPGLRLLREYFVLPAKFAFVELAGTPLDGHASRVELRFTFEGQLPQDLEVSADNLRLNCVPVANVFESTTDPIVPSLEQPVHVLRPAGLPYGLGGTYAVTRVVAGSGRTMTELPPFVAFDSAPAFWVAERHRTARGGTEVHLTLGSPADAGPVPDFDFVSVEILADNSANPNGLGIGDIARHPELQVRNIEAVTPYRAPASGEELRFRTLALITLQASSLGSLEPLKTLLHVLNLHPLADAQSARAHAKLVAALLSLEVEPAQTTSDGGFILGHDLRLGVSNAGFEGEGDILVFGSVLSRLFSHEAAVSAFTRTTVRVTETGRVFAFPALAGDRAFEP